MKHIIKNDLKIKKEELTSEVTRVKAILINSNNEILLGYSDNCYQFIGGHIEENEDLLDCLNREILEEVGIELNLSDIEPFLFLEHYCKDHPTVDENRNCKVYYYVIKTDIKPNIKKTKYTEKEINDNFRFEYIKLEKFIETITNNFNKYKTAKVVGEEMIEAYNTYKEYIKR